MSSKLLRLSLSILLVFDVSCGLNVGEKAPKDKPIKIGGSGFSCLSKLGEQIRTFLDARLSDNQVRDLVGCIQYSFESFARRTRGQDRNSYTPREIADFLEEYFIKDRKVSDDLLKDFMVIKQTLVGGPLDKVTRTDLKTAIDFLGFVGDQLLKINPFMSVYNFKLIHVAQVTDQRTREIDRAVAVLRDVAEAIGNRLAQANQSYPLSHLESFMREFRQFSGWEEVFSNARDPHAWVTFFGSYKSLLTGEVTDRILPAEWSKMLSASAGWYGVLLKLQYTRQKPTILYGLGLESFVNSVDEGLRMAKVSVENQPAKVVTFTQMERFIDSLGPVGLMPQVSSADGGQRPMSSEALKGALHALLDRMFGDLEVPWRKRQAEGLSRLSLKQMSEEFNRWTEMQRFLEKTFSPGLAGQPKTGERIVTLAEKLDPQSTLSHLLETTERDGSENLGVLQLLSIQKTMRPLFRPSEQRVFLTDQSSMTKYGVAHGFHNLSMMNIMRGMVSLLMRGYSSNANRLNPLEQGVTSEEMQAFYMDFRSLGVDLQLFDPRSSSAGQRAFREGNMFTYSSDGFVERQSPNDVSTLLNFYETMEYASFIYSGGQLGRDLYTRMMDSESGVCTKASRGGPVSVHGYPMINRQCFRDQLLAQLAPSLGPMPGMLDEVSKAGPERRRELSDGLIETAYSVKTSSPEWVEWHEVTTISVIMHYTEAVMTRYNRQAGTTLDTDEVWQAYETFSGFIRMLVRQKCEDSVGRMRAEELASESGAAVQSTEQGLGIGESWDTVKRWIAEKGCGNLPEVVNSSVFAYLVRYGKVPAGFGDIDLRARMPWVGYDFNVDRQALIKVFSALVKANSESKSK